MNVQMTEFHPDKAKSKYDSIFSVDQAREIINFHRTIKEYSPTPLRSLKNLSSMLGISGFYVKDESYRFGLNAFKGLGGSYALARLISEKLGVTVNDLDSIPENTFTFVTATDGNHGRGIAWAAKKLKQKSIVYMPKGSSLERLKAVQHFGGEVEVTDLNYDDTVRFAKNQAEKYNWTLVQDTAWPGYETIPSWIMQGYMTLGFEIVNQLEYIPTHIFLQAGVGAMAGAITGFFSNYYRQKLPRIIIVEPNRADCLFQTARANDGCLHVVNGELDSIMAGLCCGEVCSLGWDVLRHYVEYYFSCPDYIAADGMRVLGNPLNEDERVVSGESGAVTTGLVYNLLRDTNLESFKQKVNLDEKSIVLCISTEGATDQLNYEHIVWDGWYRNGIAL